jgi:membrane-bound ClpP family serine protease
MTALGLVLLFVGAILMVAEAHAPSGVLAVGAGIALIAGAVIVIGAFGGSTSLAIPVGVALGAAAGGGAIVVTRTATRARGARVQAGSEAMFGRVGVVRRWSESAGQVFVDGTLWRARQVWPEGDGEAFSEGDPVVVERVSGLTLSVRRAEEWEMLG